MGRLELEATASVGEVIGWNIRERRAARWTQPEFGRLIGTVLPKQWPAQTVSSAEKGERAFAAAEVVALAHLLEVSVAALFNPPLPVQRVVVSDHLTLPAQSLHYSGTQPNHHDDGSSKLLYAEGWSSLGRIAELRQRIVEQAELIEQESRSLFFRLNDKAGKAAAEQKGRPQQHTKPTHAAHGVESVADTTIFWGKE